MGSGQYLYKLNNILLKSLDLESHVSAFKKMFDSVLNVTIQMPKDTVTQTKFKKNKCVHYSKTKAELSCYPIGIHYLDTNVCICMPFQRHRCHTYFTGWVFIINP